MNITFKITIAFLLFANIVGAQNGSLETLEKGITEYNKLHNLSEALTESTVSAAELNAVETMLQTGTALFESVLQSPADSLHNIASYLKNNLLYDYAQVLFQSGDKAKALPILVGMEGSMDQLAALSYPLVFEGDTKAMTIQWSDFVPRLFNLNVQLGEKYFAENNYDTALVYIRKARDLNDWGTQHIVDYAPTHYDPTNDLKYRSLIAHQNG